MMGRKVYYCAAACWMNQVQPRCDRCDGQSQVTSCPTCAALDGPDSGGGRARRRRRQQQQRSASFSFLLRRAALVDRPHVAVAPHPEAARHGQRVHAVHPRLHGLSLHLAVHLLTHLLNLPVHLHLTQLDEQKKRRANVIHLHRWTSERRRQKLNQIRFRFSFSVTGTTHTHKPAHTRTNTNLTDGAHGPHVALIAGAVLGGGQQRFGVEEGFGVQSVQTSIDGNLTHRTQVTVAPDLQLR